MNKQDILKRLAFDTANAIDAMKKKIDISDRETPEQFIARGGKIQQIKQGQTSEFPDGSLPIRTPKDYRAVHDARMKICRTGGRGIEIAKRTTGPICAKCGGNIIYILNKQCVACQRSAAKRARKQ